MKPETRRFERQLIIKRNRLEKLAGKVCCKALKSQIPSEIRSLDSIELQIEFISPDPIQKFFRWIYGESGKQFGRMYYDFLKPKVKAVTADDFLDNEWLAEMERYALTEAGSRIVEINATTKKLFRDATSKAVFEANRQGLGVEKTKKLILEALNDAITPARARAIAQTELITASNRASFAGAESTGLKFRKYWSTSGLPNIRPTHIKAEEDAPDGIPMDGTFSNGLKFPGDPAGEAAETVNCRCTALYEPI